MVEQGQFFFQKDAALDPSKYDSSAAFLADVNSACSPTLTDEAFVYAKKVGVNAAAFALLGAAFEGVGAVPGALVGAVNGLFQAGDEVRARENECKARHLDKIAVEIWADKKR